MQSSVDNYIMGRVSSLFALLSQFMIFLSAMYTGFVQETFHLPVRLTIQSLGMSVMVGGFLALWLYRHEHKAVTGKEAQTAGA